MYGKRIDHMKEVSVEGLCLEDIKWWYGTGQDRTTGSGRNKEHFYRSGVMTRIGDILLSLWCELAQTLITREGLSKLCGQLEVYYRETTAVQIYAGKEGARTLHQEALQLSVSRIFDNPQWVGFIPFNRRYCPEVLKTARVVTVLMHCCQKPGEVPLAQICRAYQNAVCCPHCGRRSEFTPASYTPAHFSKIT